MPPRSIEFKSQVRHAKTKTKIYLLYFTDVYLHNKGSTIFLVIGVVVWGGRGIQGFQYFSGVPVLHYLQGVLFIIKIWIIFTSILYNTLKNQEVPDHFRPGYILYVILARKSFNTDVSNKKERYFVHGSDTNEKSYTVKTPLIQCEK